MLTPEENKHTDSEQLPFAEYLFKLSNGELHLNTTEEIQHYTISNKNVIDKMFGDCFIIKNYEVMNDKAITCTT